MLARIIPAVACFIICTTTFAQKEAMTNFLRSASANLGRIKAASYFSIRVASAPGDSLQFTAPKTSYRKIFINPADSLVGSRTLSFSESDTTRLIDFYNGVVRGDINWDKQNVVIDSFKNQHAPFRLVYYPFYTQINEIIKYALSTNDKIVTDFKDYGDSVHFGLKIINKHMYFVIKPKQIENEYIPKDEVSQYDIWFSKTDGMPYRMRSKWHHTTVFETCENARFSTTGRNFNERQYYPAYFEISQYVRRQRPESNLIGKKASEWILMDMNQNQIKLSDLKSKVLLVQFTGVGCGPCHQSIPFIKQLMSDYKTKDFEFVAIETWSNNIEGLKRYQQRNELNFKFLKSNEEVMKSYDIYSVPVFFILDEKRIIRNIINGYDLKTTNSKIIEGINELL
ncbi:TlpA disulfide reductase family protein [Chryseolinea sp. T2]|uniref:peroxiredoxin family protein n=1 Tax=Chryseolinea sp. T2 TaxID=3129255 RepID=UPI003076A396